LRYPDNPTELPVSIAGSVITTHRHSLYSFVTVIPLKNGISMCLASCLSHRDSGFRRNDDQTIADG